MSFRRGDDDERFDDDYDDYDEDEEEGFVSSSAIETLPDAIIVNGPIYAENKRGKFGATWWGQQWVSAMESLDPDARMQRGRSYARGGNVRRMEIGQGIAIAQVKGSRPRPYSTTVRLKLFNEAEWEKALKALKGQAIYAAQLLAGDMPADIESVFQSVGLSLFPRNDRDISFDCDCPDWGDPCKHAAALYYLLAEHLDIDPFVLFHLRGRSREQVMAGLRTTTPVTSSGDALDKNLEWFWSGSTKGNPVSKSHAPNVFPLAQLGDPPGNIAKALQGIYANVVKRAKARLDT